jgi:hypothetical protein
MFVAASLLQRKDKSKYEKELLKARNYNLEKLEKV